MCYSSTMKTIKCFGCLLAILNLFGCGGNSSNTSTGVFVDSAVEGLNFKTETQSGITGTNGEFTYKPGETVTFTIGDVLIGSVKANSIITPIHFGSTFSDSDITAINISRLLQSLDVDGNLDNGIQITTEIRDAMKGRSFTFNRPTADFDDASINDLFTVLNARNVFRSGQGQLKRPMDARLHLRQSLAMFGILPPNVVLQNYTSKSVFPRLTTLHIVRPPVFPRYTTVFSRYTTISAFPRVVSGTITTTMIFPRLTTSRVRNPITGVPPKSMYPAIFQVSIN